MNAIHRVIALAGLSLGLCFDAGAAAIDVTSQSLVTLPHGAQLTIAFGISNFGTGNPGLSPYPTSVGLQVYGPALANARIAQTASSVQYFADYLLQGYLQSLDGTWSVPFSDLSAGGMGLGAGALLLKPGTMNSNRVAIGTASDVLDLALSESLFAQNVGSYNAAYIVLRNEGADVVIGLGPGYTLRSAIFAPVSGGPGTIQTTGMTRNVTLGGVPEPATWVLLGAGLAGMFVGRFRGKLVKT